MTTNENNYAKTITSHYETIFKTTSTDIHFNKGPIHELPSNFAILEFPPTSYCNMWIYATCCMSQTTDDHPLELHILSPYKSEEPPEILAAIAHYHRTGAPLGVGHSVFFGKPWLSQSQCEYGLISLPYLFGPTLENLSIHNEKTVNFLWLIPITKEEVEFKKKHGLESLENRFEESQFNYADPKRPSAC